jgi:hypothetical protein
MGWIGPMLKQSGFAVDHQHNHCGQCWWEIRRSSDNVPPSEPGELAGSQDVRLRPNWSRTGAMPDTWRHSNNPIAKQSSQPSPAASARITESGKPIA